MRSSTPLAVVFVVSLLASGCTTGDSGIDAAVDLGKADLPADEPFGRICDNIGSICKDKGPKGEAYVCLAPTGGAANMGFCTKECSETTGLECYGVPNGQWAQCALRSQGTDAGPGKTFCAFLCRTAKGDWSCPGTLRCGKEENKQAICVP